MKTEAKILPGPGHAVFRTCDGVPYWLPGHDCERHRLPFGFNAMPDGYRLPCPECVPGVDFLRLLLPDEPVNPFALDAPLTPKPLEIKRYRKKLIVKVSKLLGFETTGFVWVEAP